VALYYNSISLHDGNRYTAAAKGSSLDTYKPRLKKLLDDMDRFIDTLEKSGRRVVLAVIPEHGAAIRGDKMQIAGLREIPSPAITQVPVGVRVIGPQLGHSGTVKVDAPTSYLAVNQLVAKLMEAPPFTGGSFNPSDYTADLPTTESVSENEDTVIMVRNGRAMMRQGKDGWSPYDAGGGSH
jgi:cellulose synthase operon protein YhjU